MSEEPGRSRSEWPPTSEGHQQRSFLVSVAQTSAVNVAVTGMGALGGVVLARGLNPSGRGDYAAVTTAFGFALTFFELGLSASIVYFAARDPRSRWNVVVTTTRLLMPLSLLAVVGLFALTLTPLLSEADRRAATIAVLGAVVFSFVVAPPMFSLQSSNLVAWNLLRLLQPALNLIGFTALIGSGRLTAPAATAMLSISVFVQCLAAWWWVLRVERRGRQPVAAGDTATPAPANHVLLRYGILNLLAMAPLALNARVDQLYLAVAVPSRELGFYAVAVSVSLLVVPIGLAFGNVAFPRLASDLDVRDTARVAVVGTLAVGAIGAVAVVAGAYFLLVPIFGPSYAPALPLLVVLAPGAVLFMLSQVASDVLRGMNRSGVAAVGQWLGVVLTVVGLALTVSVWGAMGAAVTSTAAYLVSALYLLVVIRREVERHHAPARPEVIA